MDSKSNNTSINQNKWWHWIIFGPFTPFIRNHGFRKLSPREAGGLIFISLAVIVLTVLALSGYI